MARRGGKAVNRRSRQRKAQRPATQPAAQQRPPTPPADQSVPEPAPTTTAAVISSPASARPPTRRPATALGSGLSERAQAEYHYVGRDLRNMAVLVAIMAVLLVGAVIVFNVTGIGPA